jgi:hypothetical protein
MQRGTSFLSSSSPSSRDSELVGRRSVVTRHRPSQLESVDVLADLTPSDDMKEGAIERLDASVRTLKLARHRFGRLSLTASCASRTLVEPCLDRDADGTVLVHPSVLLEAPAVRRPRIATSRLFVARILACRVSHQPIDAALDPAPGSEAGPRWMRCRRAGCRCPIRKR